MTHRQSGTVMRCKLNALWWIPSLNCLISVRGSISLLALGTSTDRVAWSVLPSSMRPCLRPALTPQWWDTPRNISRAAPTKGGESRVAGLVSKYLPLCRGQASQTRSAACHRSADAFFSWLASQAWVLHMTGSLQLNVSWALTAEKDLNDQHGISL